MGRFKDRKKGPDKVNKKPSKKNLVKTKKVYRHNTKNVKKENPKRAVEGRESSFFTSR